MLNKDKLSSDAGSKAYVATVTLDVDRPIGEPRNMTETTPNTQPNPQAQASDESDLVVGEEEMTSTSKSRDHKERRVACNSTR